MYIDTSVSAIMYADDILLLAPSVTELQRMIAKCCFELTLLDLEVNPLKSAILRIGSKYNITCPQLRIGGVVVDWSIETKYLGVFIKAGPKFKCNFDRCKIKFYQSANVILSKLGNQPNAAVSTHLIAAMALPALTYACEALSLNASEKNTIDHPWLRTFQRIYHTFDKNTVKQCQWYTGHLPINHYYAMRTFTFLLSLKHPINKLLRTIFDNYGHDAMRSIADSYNCKFDLFLKDYHNVILKSFYNEIV